MQPDLERPVYSTNFAYHRDATVCLYDPTKNRSVVLLSSMHMMGNNQAMQQKQPSQKYNKFLQQNQRGSMLW